MIVIVSIPSGLKEALRCASGNCQANHDSKSVQFGRVISFPTRVFISYKVPSTVIDVSHHLLPALPTLYSHVSPAASTTLIGEEYMKKIPERIARSNRRISSL